MDSYRAVMIRVPKYLEDVFVDAVTSLIIKGRIRAHSIFLQVMPDEYFDIRRVPKDEED